MCDDMDYEISVVGVYLRLIICCPCRKLLGRSVPTVCLHCQRIAMCCDNFVKTLFDAYRKSYPIDRFPTKLYYLISSERHSRSKSMDQGPVHYLKKNVS